MVRRLITAREQYEMLAPWRVAADIPDNDPLWALLDPASGGKHTPYVPPPSKPASRPPGCGARGPHRRPRRGREGRR